MQSRRAISIFLLALSFTASVARADVEEMLEETLSAVVKLQTEKGEGNNLETDFGSGFFVDESHIVTNAHVVPVQSTISVLLPDGSSLAPSSVFRDTESDLAVIRLEAATGRKFLQYSEGRARTGRDVYAVGAPFGYANSVSKGIVSAPYRRLSIVKFEDFLQTDAAVNPGNSGGPLVDFDGRVVGVVTAIQSATGNSSGVSFAISTDLARRVTDQLIQKGEVQRGYLGASLRNQPRVGAKITFVKEDSPASRAGLQVEDIVTHYGGQRVQQAHQLWSWVARTLPGRVVPLTVSRGEENLNLSLTLGEYPAPPSEQDFPGLGLTLGKVSPSVATALSVTNGLEVKSSRDAALKAGIASGAVITHMDATEITTLEQFAETLKKKTGNVLLRVVSQKGSSQFILLEIK